MVLELGFWVFGTWSLELLGTSHLEGKAMHCVCWAGEDIILSILEFFGVRLVVDGLGVHTSRRIGLAYKSGPKNGSALTLAFFVVLQFYRYHSVQHKTIIQF
ncbi:hypothetical protein BDY21DRAFT_342183 [Lineolata rhizophorae]|uniref:Uncharacterized protein n=1 Tax=Lineolata rhizophorae TaxID=578093 RepID=A0A6A6P3J8_9PEZI|nr:hypothetical protein BDY21DRAFT_342183 [Lineolata rhizophorae]